MCYLQSSNAETHALRYRHSVNMITKKVLEVIGAYWRYLHKGIHKSNIFFESGCPVAHTYLEPYTEQSITLDIIFQALLLQTYARCYAILMIKTRTLYNLDRHPANWVTSPALTFVFANMTMDKEWPSYCTPLSGLSSGDPHFHLRRIFHFLHPRST